MLRVLLPPGSSQRANPYHELGVQGGLRRLTPAAAAALRDDGCGGEQSLEARRPGDLDDEDSDLRGQRPEPAAESGPEAPTLSQGHIRGGA